MDTFPRIENGRGDRNYSAHPCASFLRFTILYAWKAGVVHPCTTRSPGKRFAGPFTRPAHPLRGQHFALFKIVPDNFVNL